MAGEFKNMKLLLTLSLLFAVSLTIFAQAKNERDKGIEFYRQGEYEKAIEILQESVKAENKDRLAWMYLGASFVKLKREDDAVKAFLKTNTVYDKNFPVYDKKLKITKKARVNYSNRAASNLTSGVVKLAVEFGADGKIGFVFPFQALPDGLTESSVKAAKAIKFEPAIQNGKPVTVVLNIEYSFSF